MDTLYFVFSIACAQYMFWEYAFYLFFFLELNVIFIFPPCFRVRRGKPLRGSSFHSCAHPSVGHVQPQSWTSKCSCCVLALYLLAPWQVVKIRLDTNLLVSEKKIKERDHLSCATWHRFRWKRLCTRDLPMFKVHNLVISLRLNLQALLVGAQKSSSCSRDSFKTSFASNSFIFVPTYPLERVAGAASLGGLEIPHDQQQSQIVLFIPHQDGTKQGWRCSHSTWSLGDQWVAASRVRPCVQNVQRKIGFKCVNANIFFQVRGAHPAALNKY